MKISFSIDNQADSFKYYEELELEGYFFSHQILEDFKRVIRFHEMQKECLDRRCKERDEQYKKHE